MQRPGKQRRHGDPVAMPGNLTDQINQDRTVINKKARQKQKRKHEEDDEERVSHPRRRLRWTWIRSVDYRWSSVEKNHRTSSGTTKWTRLWWTRSHQSRTNVRICLIECVTSFHLCRDLESIERISKLKKSRKDDDSDDEDVDAQEDDYEDEVSVGSPTPYSPLFYLRPRSMKKTRKRWKRSCPINLVDSWVIF